jgi:hypothetical protein
MWWHVCRCIHCGILGQGIEGLDLILLILSPFENNPSHNNNQDDGANSWGSNDYNQSASIA